MATASVTVVDRDGKEQGSPINVQFNPETLSVSYTGYGTQGSGGAEDDGRGSSAQRTGHSTSLSLDLLFDTSESGKDVRNSALQIVNLLFGTKTNTVPLVRFLWGTFLFYGRIDSVNEELSYFSDEGMPLRATLSLSMSGDRLNNEGSGDAGFSAAGGFSAGFSAGVGFGASAGFSAGASAGVSGGVGAGFSASAGVGVGATVGTSPLKLSASGESVQGIAASAGKDWKAVASANGIDNPRQLQAGTVLNLNAKASVK